MKRRRGGEAERRRGMVVLDIRGLEVLGRMSGSGESGVGSAFLQDWSCRNRRYAMIEDHELLTRPPWQMKDRIFEPTCVASRTDGVLKHDPLHKAAWCIVSLVNGSIPGR